MPEGNRPSSLSPESPVRRLLNPWRLEPRALVLYHLLVLVLAVFTFDRIAAWQILPADDSREIVLVGSRSCPHSAAVRAHLRTVGAPFREIRQEDDPVSSTLAVWALQSFRVPIVLIGPEIVYGNRRDRIDDALAKLGYATHAETPEPEPGEPLG